MDVDATLLSQAQAAKAAARKLAGLSTVVKNRRWNDGDEPLWEPS